MATPRGPLPPALGKSLELFGKEVLRQLVPIIPRKPSVYDWHEPTRNPPGYFITKPDYYVWFDPIKGVDIEPEKPPEFSITRRIITRKHP